MVWVGRDLKDHPVPARPGSSKSYPTWPWTLPGRGIHSFSGLPIPGPHHTHRKEFFFFVANLNLPSFSLKPLPLVLLLHVLVKSPSPAFLWTPFRYWKAAIFVFLFNVLFEMFFIIVRYWWSE